MKTYKIKIEFKTLPRLGKAGLDDQAVRDHLGADQFFSALSLAWIELFGLDDYESCVLKPFLDNKLPWRHSSFFPEIEGKFYLPSPFLKLTENKIEKKERKPWINFDAWEKVIQGDELTKDDYSSATQEYSYYSARLSCVDETKPYITTVIGPKATDQNRSTNKKNFCLSGFIDLHDNNLLSKINGACKFLTEEGIGANRSSGYGQIEQISIEEFNFASVNNPNRWITLSDYIPAANELSKIQTSKLSAYKLISKSGWIYSSSSLASDQRKSKIYMMSVGSSFDIPIQGSLVNVGTKDYPSYRYGLAYSIGVNL
jgi:CRISPR type III-A-associated RAMP protein Csm4